MLSANTNGHLLGDEFKAVHKTLSEVFDVMVSQNEVFTASEGANHVIPKTRSAMGEITQMEDNAIIRHGFPPSADEFGIHLLYISERPAAETDNVLMSEVGVRGEPDLIWVEFVDLFVHCCLF